MLTVDRYLSIIISSTAFITAVVYNWFTTSISFLSLHKQMDFAYFSRVRVKGQLLK